MSFARHESLIILELVSQLISGSLSSPRSPDKFIAAPNANDYSPASDPAIPQSTRKRNNSFNEVILPKFPFTEKQQTHTGALSLFNAPSHFPCLSPFFHEKLPKMFLFPHNVQHTEDSERGSATGFTVFH